MLKSYTLRTLSCISRIKREEERRREERRTEVRREGEREDRAAEDTQQTRLLSMGVMEVFLGDLPRRFSRVSRLLY